MWSNSEYIWPNAQRNWPNFARAFNELRSHWSLLVGLTKCAAHLGKRAAHLAKRALILQNVAHLVKFRTFYQLVRCTMRIWPNAQIGQMLLHACVGLNWLLVSFLSHVNKNIILSFTVLQIKVCPRP